MKKIFLTVLLLTLLLFSAACWKSSDSTTDNEPSSIDVFGLTDETTDAAKIIQETNDNQLKKIKIIYKNSQGQFEELRQAMKDNDAAKVKQLSGELADRIDEGMNLGNEAVENIEQAKKLKINDTYREYLDLKESALKMQLQAFDFRFEAAKFLRDEFQTKDKKQIEQAKAVLKEKDDSFQKYMAEAHETTMQANQLAKDSMHKNN